jgi:hypothetical protein
VTPELAAKDLDEVRTFALIAIAAAMREVTAAADIREVVVDSLAAEAVSEAAEVAAKGSGLLLGAESTPKAVRAVVIDEKRSQSIIDTTAPRVSTTNLTEEIIELDPPPRDPVAAVSRSQALPRYSEISCTAHQKGYILRATLGCSLSGVESSSPPNHRHFVARVPLRGGGWSTLIELVGWENVSPLAQMWSRWRRS